MRPSDGQPVRLSEYRAPDYFIDHVELDVSLDIHATRVVSSLTIRPNPAGRAGAALALDGDELMIMKEADIMGVVDPAAATRKAA